MKGPLPLPASAGPWLDRRFHLAERRTTPRRELVSGVTTFMTMAYIIFVNPALLAAAGMPKDAVTAATCLGAAIPTLLMGFYANYPLALASGMGLNAAVVLHATQPGMNWQTLMGVVVIEGALVTAFVLTGVREQVMQAIPMNLKRAIGVGIGWLIAFLGLQNMGWVERGAGLAFLGQGHFTAKPTLVATIGLLLIVGLLAYRVRGAILLGILGTAAFAWLADRFASGSPALVHLPSQVIAAPSFATFGQADLLGAIRPALVAVIFAFLITDFFDTMGTVIGIGGQGGFLDVRGSLPGLKRVLLVDSLGAVWGGICGASSVTTYIESAAGVSDGGRTGLVAVTAGVLFLLAMFFTPVIGAVPAVATAPALVVVGFLMMSTVREMELASVDDGLPGFLTVLLIPLSQSIACGIGVGFIAFVALRVMRGRGREVSPWLYGIAALFALSFAWGKS